MKSTCILKKAKKLINEKTLNKVNTYHFNIVEKDLVFSPIGAIYIAANDHIKYIINSTYNVDIQINEIDKYFNLHNEFLRMNSRFGDYFLTHIKPNRYDFYIQGSLENYIFAQSNYSGYLPERTDVKYVHKCFDIAIEKSRNIVLK